MFCLFVWLFVSWTLFTHSDIALYSLHNLNKDYHYAQSEQLMINANAKDVVEEGISSITRFIVR